MIINIMPCNQYLPILRGEVLLFIVSNTFFDQYRPALIDIGISDVHRYRKVLALNIGKHRMPILEKKIVMQYWPIRCLPILRNQCSRYCCATWELLKNFLTFSVENRKFCYIVITCTSTPTINYISDH